MARLFNNFLVADRPILEAADQAKRQITKWKLGANYISDC
jgi:hypothetical protein